MTAGGTGTSTGVTLTDTLPDSGLTWSIGGADAAACSIAASVLTCNFGDMASGSTKTITLTATTSEDKCPSIQNTATVSSTNDTDTSNNSSGPITIAIECPPGNQGCTPGYWKQSQHFDSWVGFTQSQSVGGVFSGVAGVCPTLANKTLLQALNFKGGNTLCEKVQILLRAAVAAVLNAANPNVSYPLSVSEVQSMVNTALATHDPDTILDLATLLDDDNNLGCPLN